MTHSFKIQIFYTSISLVIQNFLNKTELLTFSINIALQISN